jgi:pimeloyl-ACP methyl ester carboxylesterase
LYERKVKIKYKEVTLMSIFSITLLLLLLAAIMTHITVTESFLDFVSAQPVGNITASSLPLPVILIHGWASDASVWDEWSELLGNDGIQFFPITFEGDDECGTSNDHAQELVTIVEQIKEMTGQDKVNIVGHSKGGLDARVYLDLSNTDNVANLVMIGTPNAGSLIAIGSNICAPAVDDLVPGSEATMAERNLNTKYHTIAGDWLPPLGNWVIPGHDDGYVAISSVESQPYFKNLGHTNDYHLNLVDENEYNLAKQILK